jgi:hypothetical protein
MRIGRMASPSTRALLRHLVACEVLRFSWGTREAGAGIASQKEIKTANGAPYCENFMLKQQLTQVWDDQLSPYAKLWSLYPIVPAEELPGGAATLDELALFSQAHIDWTPPSIKRPSIKREGEAAGASRCKYRRARYHCCLDRALVAAVRSRLWHVRRYSAPPYLLPPRPTSQLRLATVP